MAGAERFILDVEIKFDKSEKNFQEFARRSQRAVQQANAQASQAAGKAYTPPVTPGAIGREVGQTASAITVAGAQQGVPQADINRALQANVEEGRRRVLATADERGYTESQRKQALETYNRNILRQTQLSQVAVNEAVKQAEQSRQTTVATTQSASAERATADQKRRIAALQAKRAQAADRRFVAEALAGDQEHQANLAAARAANMRARALATQAASTDPSVLAARTAAEVAASQANANVRASRDRVLASDPRYRDDIQASRQAQRQASAGIDPETGRLADSALARRTQTELQVAQANDEVRAATRRNQAANTQAVQATAERTAADRAYKGIVDQRMRQEILAGRIDVPGGRFQRLTAGLGYRGGSGGDGLGVSAGQFLGGGLLTTLKFALPSIALFGAARGISDAIKEAQELDKIFTEIDQQYNATFGDGAQAQADDFKDKILEIARATGQAGAEVAEVGRQFVGAFSDQSVDILDTQTGELIRTVSGQQLVDENLEAVSKGAAVTGIEEQIISNEGVATATAFSATMEQILNLTTQLRNEVGADESELLNFLGDVAPAAKDAGFALEEIAAIGAVTLRESGRSGSAIAEAYGRVLPAISESTTDILALAAANEELNNQEFLSAVANNDTATIFRTLMTEFEGLNVEAQNFVINLLGGRREAAAILPAFGNAEKISEIIQGLDRNSGDLERRFDKVQETLSNTLARLAEQFRQFGAEIYESGLADSLSTVATLLSGLLTGLSAIASVFVELNDATGGWAAKLLTLTAIVGGLSKAMRALAASNTVAGLTSALGGGSARGISPGAFAATQAPGFIGPVLPGRAPGPGMAGFAGFAGYGGPAERLRTVGGGFRQSAGAPKVGGTAAALISVIGLSAVMEVSAAEDAQVEAAADALRERMKTATRAELEEIQASRAGVLSRLAGAVFNEDMPEEMAAQELGSRTASENAELYSGIRGDSELQGALGDAIDTSNEDFINRLGELYRQTGNERFNLGEGKAISGQSEGIKKLVADLAKEAADGNLAAQELLDDLIATDSPEIVSAIREINSEDKKQEAVENAVTKMEEATASLEQLRGEYETGDLPLSTLLSAYDAQINTMQRALSLSNEGNQQISIALAKMQKERAQVYSAAALQQADIVSEIEVLARGEGPEQTESQLGRLIGLLNDPQFSDSKSRIDTSKKVAGLYREILQQQIDGAETAAEAAAIAERGIDISPVARVELILAQLDQNNAAYNNYIQQYQAATGEDGSAVVRAVFLAIARNDQAMLEFYRQDIISRINVINEEIAKMEAAAGFVGSADQAQGLQAQIQKLTEARNYLFGLLFVDDLGDVGAVDPGTRINDPRRAAQERERAEEERRRKAEEDAENRRRWFEELDRQERELRAAQFDLVRAVFEEDPVAVARVAQAEADYELSKATNEAEKLNALAARVRADRALRDAMKAIFDSQINLAKASADAIGDTVQSATIDYFAAVVELNRLLAEQPNNTAAINNARAAVITAQAALEDTKIQKQLDDYAYLYDMEQITKDQYISYLQALRATLDPEKQQDAFRDISRTIKQLQGDLAGDLQFNLPGSIDLPTLYEVRRVNQGTSGVGSNAIGYQDNRQINVQMVITNGMTQQQAADFLAAAVGTNRTGYSFRSY